MVLTQPALLCTLLICAVASVALPLDIGLDLKGMSNKLRSGSAAIANTYQPFDMQRERIVKHNGNIVYLESEPGPEPEPEPEDSDEGLDSEPIPLEELGILTCRKVWYSLGAPHVHLCYAPEGKRQIIPR
ncbi:hypothetical protein C7212DRAFT_361740 [Tuber magnatum]|uniref:Uncharacterized protein n=1 Tax=Tuber magnatum TaxID=42249 RepID=A0A317T0F0_9PEZI|nr:hypothetical protein C7212DRAFT_361740 [Tuber magnatum]